jgi:hypothetical protein
MAPRGAIVESTQLEKGAVGTEGQCRPQKSLSPLGTDIQKSTYGVDYFSIDHGLRVLRYLYKGHASVSGQLPICQNSFHLSRSQLRLHPITNSCLQVDTELKSAKNCLEDLIVLA